ncbi:Asp23/Gls24 family envelope stress response protein [Marinactinospora thermotolerans]|uniref:Uncharacterized conserved protein YloU, alkaline shock protein (Asp23) family n=1 Tax=Marinactinospora thermotolerans DSM 45154 TaxID=1122192 RepID=A0A1T4RVW4_9ACTN|nr:Asp23/Gls24 family envelope stress response protein [Marinactinospora thermotolerans]SKA20144.1 Uncharacterized conserved protein YloU, alkaline shock protein (Asp23) family [Marinactinospora thermotolerans DSM 45154]
MSTTAAPPRTVPRQRPRPAEPEQRGSTTIPERVVAKIAARAAAEVGGTRRVGGGVTALLGSSSRPAKASARINGTTVSLRLGIAVRYPAPVRSTAREVREHVRERVEQTTGLTVRHIDIEITGLVRDGRAD